MLHIRKKVIQKNKKQINFSMMPAEKKQKLCDILNRYSLFFHMILACLLCFTIEWISRHSFLDACSFLVSSPLVFFFNALIIYSTLSLSYLFRRRAEVRVLISFIWLFLGTINGCILLKRVSPFCYTDLKMVTDLFTMQSNYFTAQEAVLVIVAVAAVIAVLIMFWFKGPVYHGSMHRIRSAATVSVFAVCMPALTQAAINSNLLAAYFENLAQGYKNYGFVYSFTESLLDIGMKEPDNYSEDTVLGILSKINEDTSLEVSAEEEQIDWDFQDEEDENSPVTAGEPEERIDVKTMSSVEDSQEEIIQSFFSQIEGSEIFKNRLQSGWQESALSLYSGENEEEEQLLLLSELDEQLDKKSADDDSMPNIICVLLESFVDPDEVKFLELSEDAVPNFHYLYENYSSGYLEVPVVGAGTANTEFEILTGMSMKYFGLGEYPYKTILKKTNCESIASDLSDLGYGTHAVHNNGGNFYSRRNAFSMFGFDTFTCKEMMDIREYTPLGTWPTDEILVGEVEKSLDYTTNSCDFVYTITVQGHGDYPEKKVIENPAITVSGDKEETVLNKWEYYVNEIHEVDQFIAQLIEMLGQRDEKTFVVFFGDHLPTMDLTDDDMESGSIFQTQYVTWNNFGLEKEDADVTSYQLMAQMLEELGIHTGTMFQFHQNRDVYDSEEEYLESLELLQYDILYGDHYVYGGENPYPATDLEMGTQDIKINKVKKLGDYYYIYGENFTKWSKLYVNGKKVSTKYLSSKTLRVSAKSISTGQSQLVVNQVGSSSTIFRSSNTYILYIRETTEH